MATTTTASNDENPKKTIVSDPNLATETETSAEKPSTNATKDAGGGEPKSIAGDSTAVNEEGGSTNDTQKKFRRAERFGMPVNLSEEEKRNSRAERFGTVTGSQGSSDVTKKAEDVKRKARAERFGITESVPKNENEKKKARLAKYAPVSNTIDPAEEEKKKARALRFADSQVNGKDKIEPTAAIAGKTAGTA